MAQRGRGRQGRCVWIAVRPMERVGRHSLCEPLQQGLSLRMVSGGHSRTLQGYREGCIRQHLNRISGFKVSLANARFAGELPSRGNVVDEWIVESFSNLVADRCHVVESAAKDSRRNPA